MIIEKETVSPTWQMASLFDLFETARNKVANIDTIIDNLVENGDET